jgi:hypothetical protein
MLQKGEMLKTWVNWKKPTTKGCLFFFFGSPRVWTQGFALAKQVLYHLSDTYGPDFFHMK